jgi:hypothetical protein
MAGLLIASFFTGVASPGETGAARATPAARAEFIRLLFEVHLPIEDVARVTGGAKDPLTGDQHLKIAPLVRELVKGHAVELATDPDNIGLPRFSLELERFKSDDKAKTYFGKMTIDFYLPRK